MPHAPTPGREGAAGYRDAQGERGGSREEVGGLEIDRMAAARLQHELEHRRGVQVVELDGLPDPPSHQDLRAPLPPVVLQRLAVLRRVLHAGDVLDTLAMRIEEVLVDAWPADRLDELEAESVDRGLGADHPVLDLLAADDRVVQQRWLVVEHAPRAPAEILGIRTQRGLHVGNDDGDLRDRHRDRWRHDAAAGTACHRYLLGAWVITATMTEACAATDDGGKARPGIWSPRGARAGPDGGQAGRGLAAARREPARNRRSSSSRRSATSSLVTSTLRNPPCRAPRIASAFPRPPPTPTTLGMRARSHSSIPILRSWIGRFTDVASAAKNWPRMSPTTPCSRRWRTSSAARYPICTMVASARWAPKPTNALFTGPTWF